MTRIYRCLLLFCLLLVAMVTHVAIADWSVGPVRRAALQTDSGSFSAKGLGASITLMTLGDPFAPFCLAVFDFDANGLSDGVIDLDDFYGFQECFSGVGQTPPADCFRPAPEGVPPGAGSFALHGGMVDVLSSGREGPEDALALQYSRARYFDLKHGRFLQRDPKGYIDGANLYEAFLSNPLRFRDALGMQSYPWEYTADNPYREQFLRDPCSAAGRGPAEAFRKGHEALAAMREADYQDMLESWKTPRLIGESPPWGEHKIAAVKRILSEKHFEAIQADLSLLTPLNAPDVYLNLESASSDELCFEIWLDFGVYAARTTSEVTGAAALGLQGGQAIASRWVAARGLRSSGVGFGGATRLSDATYSLWDDVPRTAKLWEVSEAGMGAERAAAMEAAVTLEKEQLLFDFAKNTPMSAAGRFGALDRLAGATRIESAAPVGRGRTFWSGGTPARTAAETWAAANVGTTLEMTSAGQNLTRVTQGMSWQQARPLWAAESRNFAAKSDCLKVRPFYAAFRRRRAAALRLRAMRYA